MDPAIIVCEGRRDNLQISEDTDLDDVPIAVFLFTPDMKDTTNHYHIDLKVEQAEKLFKWLGQFLEKNKK